MLFLASIITASNAKGKSKVIAELKLALQPPILLSDTELEDVAELSGVTLEEGVSGSGVIVLEIELSLSGDDTLLETELSALEDVFSLLEDELGLGVTLLDEPLDELPELPPEGVEGFSTNALTA